MLKLPTKKMNYVNKLSQSFVERFDGFHQIFNHRVLCPAVARYACEC